LKGKMLLILQFPRQTSLRVMVRDRREDSVV
jgi:hypothetical protein